MSRVVIGVVPHKASNTVVVIDAQERVLAQQRFANDRAGYRSMKSFARAHRDRVWAVEGARGVGAGLAQRLVAEGEPVLDVPARLSARVRALGGGSGRKTDDADAFAVAVAVAVAGLRARDLQVVRPEDTTEIMRILSTRRQEVVAHRIATVNRLHDVLCQLIPGGAKRHLSATKARQLLSAVRPRDAVGKARKQLALDYLGDLERLDTRLKELKKRLRRGPHRAPDHADGDQRGRADQRREDPRRGRRRPPVPSRAQFASYTGTAPVDVSSGDNNRHRLNRGGNRWLNHALHIAAVVQYRMPGPGQDYYRRKRDQGKTHLEGCAASSGGSPTSSTAISSTTRQQGAREDKWGRLFNPARLT